MRALEPCERVLHHISNRVRVPYMPRQGDANLRDRLGYIKGTGTEHRSAAKTALLPEPKHFLVALQSLALVGGGCNIGVLVG